VHGFEVKLKSFAALRIAARHPLALFARQSQTQFVSNFSCDIRLQSLEVGDFSPKVLAPELRPIGSFHKVGLNVDPIAPLGDSAGQHRFDAQLAADDLRIDLLAFERESCGSGDHLQAGSRRQAIDYAFGNAVRQVLRFGLWC
jgi:hypothetical protein